MMKRLCSVIAAVALSACANTQTLSPDASLWGVRLDHASVWVEDIEATSRFLTEIVGWKRHPLSFGIDAKHSSTGAMDLAFIDANGFWLELVSPTSPGPGMDVLKNRGDGHIGELAFEPRDYDSALASMKARGIPMLNMDGTPLKSEGGAITQSVHHDGALTPSDIRIAYWPKDRTYGTSVEMYEYRPGVPTDAFTIRNRTRQQGSAPPNTPRVDRIAIIVADIERSARFYTEVLGLKRHPETFPLNGATNSRSGGMNVTFIDANGIWLALVQPVGPGPLMDYLTEKGDGYIAELIAEVDDLGQYYDAMKAKGIQMVDTSGAPVDDLEKAHVLEPFGDRIAYFPTSVSHGMVIEISQRGPRNTSLIHKRDAWKH
jgi:catechol 2,3-dioxygenase-like lactoylglutathione lyase family enzyme